MAKATLIYDNECPLCTRAAGWVAAHGTRDALDTLPCKSPARAERFPNISEQACMEAMQLVLPDGRVYSGDQALPLLLNLIRGWRWLAALFRIPGVSLLSPVVYRWIARHRQALSVIVGRGCNTKGSPQ